MKATKSLFGILTIAAALAVQVRAQNWLTNGLVAYYPFNGNANDASGNGHDGVINGTSISPITDQVGNPNRALHFGGGSYISVTPTPFNVNSNWTISLWCILDANDEIANFVSTGNDNQGGLNMRYVYRDPLPWALAFIGSGWGAAKAPTPATTWNMFTCLINGDLFEMFLNNVRVISTNVVVPTIFDAGSLWFGEHQNPTWPYALVGSLSDIRIYNRALSDSEVQQLYAYESPPLVNLIKAVKPSFLSLSVGTNYQLQVSPDMNTWTDQGSPFTATNTSMVYPQCWDVDNWNQLFFRLQVSP
jgi:hypothetical protein